MLPVSNGFVVCAPYPAQYAKAAGRRFYFMPQTDTRATDTPAAETPKPFDVAVRSGPQGRVSELEHAGLCVWRAAKTFLSLPPAQPASIVAIVDDSWFLVSDHALGFKLLARFPGLRVLTDSITLSGSDRLLKPSDVARLLARDFAPPVESIEGRASHEELVSFVHKLHEAPLVPLRCVDPRRGSRSWDLLDDIR